MLKEKAAEEQGTTWQTSTENPLAGSAFVISWISLRMAPGRYHQLPTKQRFPLLKNLSRVPRAYTIKLILLIEASKSVFHGAFTPLSSCHPPFPILTPHTPHRYTPSIPWTLNFLLSTAPHWANLPQLSRPSSDSTTLVKPSQIIPDRHMDPPLTLWSSLFKLLWHQGPC